MTQPGAGALSHDTWGIEPPTFHQPHTATPNEVKVQMFLFSPLELQSHAVLPDTVLQTFGW